MSIRSKVTLLLTGIFVILGAAVIMVGKLVIMRSFAELERADARTAMRRIDYALTENLDQVAVDARDWGNWADTYRYMQDHNPDFPAANITSAALKLLDVNLVMLVDRSGTVLLAQDVDGAGERSVGLEMTRWRTLPADFPWHDNLASAQPARGLWNSNRGVLLLAAGPVLDGNGGGPSRGMIIMGRILTPAVLQHIAAQAQAQLAMLPQQALGKEDRLEATATLTRVFRGYRDMYGKPLMTLQVDVPREVSLRGAAAVRVAALCMLAAAVLVILLLVAVLNRVILTPLRRVTRHAVKIGEGHDLTTRIDLRRADEMGVLANEFNRMVERLAESHAQLVDQSYQSGFAEQARGVLHNLGNALTPLGVRLANVAERLRAAPAEDATQAVRELQGTEADAERRRDLEEFVRLAACELAQTVHATQEDVATMGRQTTVIQGMLAEQMRATRSEHVIEPVRLPELLTQSLDIVPDAARQRLRVIADPTLQQVGTVRLPRTVLRLVLQNLIINAADAVRDAGKEHGTFRVSAEIVRDAAVPQLHVQCQDDGAGIAAENLQRVFEKGYSTKSRETNHGIGLHWCANALNALGGRIWAASEGPGHGAALHLLVPITVSEPAAAAAA
ncbi:MAG: HAMP domain-containing protein [Gammaproteobacteria bacterium]|nr:HAMP domain-containing protein [Gammaproteobacteria bacterium]